jgi:hypothetical protein
MVVPAGPMTMANTETGMRESRLWRDGDGRALLIATACETSVTAAATAVSVRVAMFMTGVAAFAAATATHLCVVRIPGVVIAAATGDFADFFEAAGGHLGQGVGDGDGVAVEDANAVLAQVVEQAATDAAGANDGVDFVRGGAAVAVAGIDIDAFTAIAIDDQQRRRGAETGGDLGIQAIELVDGQTDFHDFSLVEGWLSVTGMLLVSGWAMRSALP